MARTEGRAPISAFTAPPPSQARAVLVRIAWILLAYAAYVVALGSLAPEPPARVSSPAAAQAFDAGRRLWRRSGCQACHSLYGLGGHLGPDLTNVHRRSTPDYIAATVRAGLGGMPAFELSRPELADLVAFLERVDASATYPLERLASPAFGEWR